MYQDAKTILKNPVNLVQRLFDPPARHSYYDRAVSYRFPWHRLTDEQLLDLRICDLPIKIKGSFLEPQIIRLYGELNDRGIRFKPHVWLSEEWFSPDGVPGIAMRQLIGTLSGGGSNVLRTSSMRRRSPAVSPIPSIPPQQTDIPLAWTAALVVIARHELVHA